MFQAPYRAAVIGRTGRGDYGHGLDVALLDQPKLKVVAVADENPSGLAAAAKRLKVEQAYADYREMLDREKPQFVVVGPRWIDAHREIIVACAERGANIFTEKPFAPTLADCDAIADACARSHVKLAIAFQTRYSPRYEQVKKLIDDGAIGELLEIRGRGKEDRRGGGEDLFVLGSHIMDLFRGFLGDAAWCFARVTENGQPVGKAQVRQGAEGLGLLAGDRIDALYGFTNTPVLAYFATSRPKEHGSRFGIQLLGSKGRIDMGTGWMPPAFLLADPTWRASSSGSRWVEISSAGPGKPETMGSNDLVAANRLIVADWIQAVENDTQPKVNLEDARGTVEMILATYASHIQKAPVSIPLRDRQRHPLETFGEGAP